MKNLSIPAVLVALVSSIVGLTWTAHAVVKDAERPVTHWMERPCAYEDSSNCFWNSGTRGNRSGHSFYAHTMDVKVGEKTYDRMVCLMFTDHDYAQRNDRCFSEQANNRTSGDLDGDSTGGEN